MLFSCVLYIFYWPWDESNEQGTGTSVLR